MTNNVKKIVVRVVASARGFTLIETMVAVLLLSSAIAGPLTIASKGLNASVVAKGQISAFYLAQDAIEYIRFKRDTNKLTGAPWLTGLSTCVSADGSASCYIDSIQDTVCNPGAGGCTVLNYDSNNHYFSYTTGTPTPDHYARTIKITTLSADEAAIQVTVSWFSTGLTHSVVLRENIFNW